MAGSYPCQSVQTYVGHDASGQADAWLWERPALHDDIVVNLFHSWS